VRQRNLAAALPGFIVGIVVVGGIFLLGLWWLNLATDTVPWCTDAIADAGGICHGEPLPKCVTEDQDHPDCYWDGGANGRGRTFVVIDGEVIYQ
jgi:hypothetical protein